jgi:hypothetical protein
MDIVMEAIMVKNIKCPRKNLDEENFPKNFISKSSPKKAPNFPLSQPNSEQKRQMPKKRSGAKKSAHVSNSLSKDTLVRKDHHQK